MHRARLLPIFSHIYLACALFNPRIPILWSVFSGIILLLLIYSNKTSKNWLNSLKSQTFFQALYLYLIYYLCSCFVWSNNLAASMHSLSIQSPLFLIPLIFILLNPSKQELREITNAWVRVVIAVTFIELICSTWRYYHNHDINVFFTNQLSFLTRLHSTYFSMYLLVTFGFIARNCLPNYNNRKKLILSISTLLFISFIAYLLGSKILLICFLIGWIIFGIKLIKFLPIKLSLSILGFCALLLCLWVLTFKVNLNRYRGLSDWRPKNYSDQRAELDQREQDDSTRWTTISFRVALWESGLHVFREHPYFGVGVGDMQEYMLAEYRTKDFKRAIEDRSKLHNTFLDIGIESGIIGIILFFMAIFFFPLYQNLLKNNYTNILLLLALFISMQFESYTARVHYEIFLALILCLTAYRAQDST